MKLADLAKELNISLESLRRFIQDFDLELSECLYPNCEVKPDFDKFARENADFLRKYEKDLDKTKSAEEIADKINRPKEKVEEILSREIPQVYDNGLYKSSVSSFGIDNKLGGNYHFIYNYFGHKTPLTKKDFIGYRDLFFYITDVLEPFINHEEAKNWGIHKPAGIVLYGPPGSGKIFWAQKISEIIGYELRGIKKHYLGTSFIDGNKMTFNDFLVSMMNSENVELFMEDFDEIMRERNENYSSESEETKEIIMHYINRFEEENILMVGSATTISVIDEEVTAPGRFDVLIPVFPPNAKERAEIILYSMIRNLSEDALLFKILKYNKADLLPFWNESASKMRTFSNTMVIDFTQSLKKRIRNLYKRTKNEHLEISKSLLDSALRDSASKLTEEYLNQIQQFIYDVSVNNADDFSMRLHVLQKELDAFKIVEEPRRSIGFHTNDDDQN